MQETASLLYMNYIPGEANHKVLSVAQSSLEVLQKAKHILTNRYSYKGVADILLQVTDALQQTGEKDGKNYIHPGSNKLQLLHVHQDLWSLACWWAAAMPAPAAVTTSSLNHG